MWKNCITDLKWLYFEFINCNKTSYYSMGDKAIPPFLSIRSWMVTLRVDFDCFLLGKPHQKVKIHPSDDHPASNSCRQRGWNFIYPRMVTIITTNLNYLHISSQELIGKGGRHNRSQHALLVHNTHSHNTQSSGSSVLMIKVPNIFG